ncbi:MAG: serine protein kinase RIO [Candidatus Micrarchaeia archaeon]
MARRVSKRKRPSREKYILKEHQKVEEGVFNEKTVQNLGKLITHNIISKLYFIIAKGKEADVYLAEHGSLIKENIVVVKIFRVENSGFEKRLDYIIGDLRFTGIKKSMHNLVNTWCKKEYGNLKLAEEAKVNAPKPYAFFGNVLAMEFIGKDSIPAKTLKEEMLIEPNEVFDKILLNIKKLYKVGLIHGDISEYNILINSGEPYIIDFGQAVVKSHPMAIDFLKRDILNVCSYFSKKYNVKSDAEKIFYDIISTDKQ